MTVVAKVTSKGQITLPKEVRKLLAVDMGSLVIFETEGDRVFLKPVKTLREFKGALKGRKPAADSIQSGRPRKQRWERGAMAAQSRITAVVDTNLLVRYLTEDDPAYTFDNRHFKQTGSFKVVQP